MKKMKGGQTLGRAPQKGRSLIAIKAIQSVWNWNAWGPSEKCGLVKSCKNGME